MQRFHILAAGNIVATSPLVLHWMCDSPRTGCAQRTPHMWCEQAILESSWHVISGDTNDVNDWT